MREKNNRRLGGRVAVLAVTCALGLPLAFAAPAIAEESLTGGGSSDVTLEEIPIDNDVVDTQSDDNDDINGSGIEQVADDDVNDDPALSAQSEGDGPSVSAQSENEHASWPEWFRDWDNDYRGMIDYERQTGKDDFLKELVLNYMEHRLTGFETKADQGLLTESDSYELTNCPQNVFEQLLKHGSEGVLADGQVFNLEGMLVLNTNNPYADGYGSVAIPVKNASYRITVRSMAVAPDSLREMIQGGDITAELRPEYERDIVACRLTNNVNDYDYVIIRLEGLSKYDSRVTEEGCDPRPSSAIGVLVPRSWKGTEDGAYREVWNANLRNRTGIVNYNEIDDTKDVLRHELARLNGDPLVQCDYMELADKWRLFVNDKTGIGKLTVASFASDELMSMNDGVIGGRYEIIGSNGDKVIDHADSYRTTVRWNQWDGGTDEIRIQVNAANIGRVATLVQPNDATWTGSAIKPTVTVKGTDPLTGKALKNGTDYTVTYKNNVKPGTATVTITGKGNYKGSLSKTFKINRPSVKSATVSVANAKWTGKALTPKPTVKLGSKTLTAGTDYTVTYKNNVRPGTATVTITGEGNYTGTVSKTFKITYPSATASFIAHMQTYGWPKDNNGSLRWSGKGGSSGVTGQSKRMEAFKAQLGSLSGTTGNIEYQAHVQGTGWQAWKKNGAVAGTIGQSKRIEAVRVKLTGDVTKYYDVYYSVHMQGHGWTKWAKNGEIAGSTGMSLRLEGIRIELVRKVDAAPTRDCDTDIVRIENGKITRR